MTDDEHVVLASYFVANFFSLGGAYIKSDKSNTNKIAIN